MLTPHPTPTPFHPHIPLTLTHPNNRQDTIPNCGDPEFRRSLTHRQVPACLDPEFRVRRSVEHEERYIEPEKRQDTIPNCGDPEFRRSVEINGKRQVPACLDPEFRV